MAEADRPSRGVPQRKRDSRGRLGARPESVTCFRVGARPVVDAEQCPNLHFPVPPVAAWRADAADPARRRPPGYRLWINAEECRNLSGSKQAITVPIHSILL